MLPCKNLPKDIENVIHQSHVAIWQLRHKHLRIFYHLCVTRQHLRLRNKPFNAQFTCYHMATQACKYQARWLTQVAQETYPMKLMATYHRTPTQETQVKNNKHRLAKQAKSPHQVARARTSTCHFHFESSSFQPLNHNFFYVIDHCYPQSYKY